MRSYAQQQLARGAMAAFMRPPRAPAAAAFERLARLAIAGAPADRMVAAARQIMTEWRDFRMPRGLFSEQLEALRADLEDGVSAAQDYLADADETDRLKAQVQLDALIATQDVFKAEVDCLLKGVFEPGREHGDRDRGDPDLPRLR